MILNVMFYLFIYKFVDVMDETLLAIQTIEL